MNFSKKWILFLVVALVFVLGACSADEADEAKGSESTAEAGKTTVENLTIGLQNDVGPLNIYTGN